MGQVLVVTSDGLIVLNLVIFLALNYVADLLIFLQLPKGTLFCCLIYFSVAIWYHIAFFFHGAVLGLFFMSYISFSLNRVTYLHLRLMEQFKWKVTSLETQKFVLLSMRIWALEEPDLLPMVWPFAFPLTCTFSTHWCIVCIWHKKFISFVMAISEYWSQTILQIFNARLQKFFFWRSSHSWWL